MPADGPVVELGNAADTREPVSRTSHANMAEAERAMQVAVGAWPKWRATAYAKRRSYAAAIARGVADRRGDFAFAISCETGKLLAEAEQEVDAAGVESRVQFDVFDPGPVRDLGEHQVAYEPLGAVLLVTPANFPLAAVLRKLVPALLAGDTAVVKASELTPLTATLLFEVIDAAGLPEGVANLVIADGRDVVPAMIEVQGLAAVSITGSSTAGAAVAEAIGARNIRLQAELGGCNVAAVLADADLDLAADAIVAHGLACCGQWCIGTTRLVVDGSVADKLIVLLLERIGAVELGAMISEAHRNGVEQALAGLAADGATFLTGGKRPDGDTTRHGWFFEPTLVEVSAETDVPEIFGPVLVLQRVHGVDAALAAANDGLYGLSISVFTDDDTVADRFVSAADAGMCHVNLGTGFRDNALPLAGRGLSGRGIPECGTFARDFFTQTKAIYRAGG